jgi:hypothetical protein
LKLFFDLDSASRFSDDIRTIDSSFFASFARSMRFFTVISL